MSTADNSTSSGFAERAQEPYASIPTDPDAFLQWASRRPREDGKYELTRGQIIHKLNNVSRAHWTVATNLLVELAKTLDRDHFDCGSADFGVKTPDGVRFPDVLVDVASSSLKDFAATQPLFIAEVLSPSSVGRDFTEKLEEYTAIASLQTYLICSQDQARLWLWQRQADGAWPKFPLELSGREEAVHLDRLGVELSTAAIFRGIPDGAG